MRFFNFLHFSLLSGDGDKELINDDNSDVLRWMATLVMKKEKLKVEILVMETNVEVNRGKTGWRRR